MLVTTSNQIREIEYSSNPLEHTNIDSQNCICVPLPFLSSSLVIFLEKKPVDDKLNTFATILCKQLKIHGDVVVIMNQTKTIDVTKDIFEMILKIMTNVSSDGLKQLTSESYEHGIIDFTRNLAKNIKEINTNIPDDVLNSNTLNSTYK